MSHTDGFDAYDAETVPPVVARYLTASEYTYTTALIGQRQEGPDQWTVVAHLEGDFPVGVVDLRYRFSLEQDRISKLIIAP